MDRNNLIDRPDKFTYETKLPPGKKFVLGCPHCSLMNILYKALVVGIVFGFIVYFLKLYNFF